MHRIHAHCTCIARTAALIARTGTHCHAHFTMPVAVRMRMVTLVMSISKVFAPRRGPVVSGPYSLRIMCSSRDPYQIRRPPNPPYYRHRYLLLTGIFMYIKPSAGAAVHPWEFQGWLLPDLLHWLASNDHYRNVSVQNNLLIVNSNSSAAVSSVELECTTENPHTYRLAECRLALRRQGKRPPCFYRQSFYSHFASSPFGMIENIV